METQSVGRSNLLLGVGSLVVIIAFFLPWYGGPGYPWNGFHNWGYLALLGWLAAVLVTVGRSVPGAGRLLPEAALSDQRPLLAAVAAEVLGMLLFLTHPDQGGMTIQFGWILAVLGALITVGGVYLGPETHSGLPG